MKKMMFAVVTLFASAVVMASDVPVRDCGDLHADNADKNTCVLVADVLTMLAEPRHQMALIKDFEAMAAANEGTLVVAVQTKDDATTAIHQLNVICTAAGAICQIGSRPLGTGEIRNVVNVFDRGAIEFMSRQEFEQVLMREHNRAHSADNWRLGK